MRPENCRAIILGGIYLKLKVCISAGWQKDVAKATAWWRHQMETFSALLAIGEFPTQRPVTRNFDVFFDQRLNKRISKQSRGWWFETLSCPLWCHRNE